MRRRHGTGLTVNEQKVLAAALRLASESVHHLYGYEVFRLLTQWEGGQPMNHGTLYRGLRSLVARGLLARRDEDGADGPAPRVYYELTPDGVAAARQAVVRLAALDRPPAWIDLGLARYQAGGS